MNRKYLVYVAVSVISAGFSAIAETGDSPAPEIVKIQDMEFEVEANSKASWISLGTDQRQEFMKSVSIKFKLKDGTAAPSTIGEETLRDAVQAAAEDKCRQIGANDRPEDLSSTSTLQLRAEISSRQVAIANQQFNGKYICALGLRP